MPITLKKIDAVVCANPKPTDFPCFPCGNAAPSAYTIDVGNPPGTTLIDARFDLVPPTRRLDIITLIEVDILDDSHLTLSCQDNNDTLRECAPIKIYALIES